MFNFCLGELGCEIPVKYGKEYKLYLFIYLFLIESRLFFRNILLSCIILICSLLVHSFEIFSFFYTTPMGQKDCLS